MGFTVNVVDDISMGITHVLRGEDHLSNTSKHLELYSSALPDLPMPMILKDPKIGKARCLNGESALIEESARHFLSQAVVNFTLLGGRPRTAKRQASKNCSKDSKRISERGAIDEKKMSHLNFEYMKVLPIEEYEKSARQALTSSNLIDENVDGEYLGVLLCEKIDSFENLPGFPPLLPKITQ